MGLQPVAGPLVPSWVYEDYFPQADETAMHSLASTWQHQGSSCHKRADTLGTHMATLADTYTGHAADAAADFAHRTRQWLDSTGDACTELARMVTRSAEYVTFTKRAINVVLAALQNTTAKVKQQSDANLVTKIIALIHIRQLQIAAQTQVKALAEAGAQRIAGLSCDIDIAPSLGRPSAKAIASYAVKTEDVAAKLPPGASAPGSHGVRNTTDPALPGGPGTDGQTGTGAPALPPDGTEAAGEQPSGDAPVDPSMVVGGGGQAADAGDAPEDGGAAPDLTGLGSQEAAERADNAMDDPDGTFDFGADDLADAGADVDSDAAAATMTGPGGPDQPGGPGVPPGADGGSTLADTGAAADGAPGGPGTHGHHDGGETLVPDDGFGGPDSHRGDHGPGGWGQDHTSAGPSGSTTLSVSGGAPTSQDVATGDASDHDASWHEMPWRESGSHDTAPVSAAPSGPAQPVPTHSYPSAPHADVQHGSSGHAWHPPAQQAAPTHHVGSSSPAPSSPAPSAPAQPQPAAPSGGDASAPLGGQPVSHHHDPGTTAAGAAPPPAPVGTVETNAPHVPGPHPVSTGPAPAAGGPAGPPGGAPVSGSSLSGSAMSGGPSGAMASGPVSTGPAPAAASTAAAPTGAAPPPSGGSTQPVPQAAPAPRPQPAPVQSGTTGAPVSGGGTAPPGSAPPGAGAPPAVSSPHQPGGVRRDPLDARPTIPDLDRGAGDSASALLVGAMLGAAGGAALIWGDLGRPASPPPPAAGPYGGTVWATQFGPGNEITAALPAGMGVAYQQVLLPGATDRFLTGRQTTVRGLIHPLDQVRHLDRPAALYAALGLGFSLLDAHGTPEAAVAADVDHLDVLRFIGIRDDDLIVPVAADVHPPDDPPIPWIVRSHERPWTGSGEAPGSLSTALIEEFELLAEAAVHVPHLAEIWRLHADGHTEHVSTFNARTGVWTGERSLPATTGTPVANGLHALTRRGGPVSATALNEHEHVLAEPPDPDDPAAAEKAGPDGLCRRTIDNGRLTGMVGIATVAHWRGARVRLLRRDGVRSLIDYAGGDRGEAVRLGLRQLDRAQWEPRWVPAGEVRHRTRLQRPYPLPEPARDVAEAIG